MTGAERLLLKSEAEYLASMHVPVGLAEVILSKIVEVIGEQETNNEPTQND